MANPGAKYGSISDVYTTLPLDIQLGFETFDSNTGKRVKLLFNSATLALPANGAFQKDLTVTPNPNTSRGTNATVTACAAANATVYGVNDNSGQIVPVSNYFWGTIGGPATVLQAANTTGGVQLVSSATPGALGACAGSETGSRNVQSLATTSTAAAVACWINGGG